MRILFLIAIKLLLINTVLSQPLIVDKIEPPNWWVGMNWNRVQLMVYGNALTNINARFDDDNLKIEEIHKIENSAYAFIDILIPPDIEARTYQLILSNSENEIRIDFQIFDRNINEQEHRGFNSDDIIYLITPDRFVNGDPSNDLVSGMRDKWNTADKLGRHGGDIQGIIDKLDYIDDLGFTAIWINPLIENDMDISYHGYGATDLYNIDPRFGNNELYRHLVNKSHQRGIKIIMDHVSNHVGKHHSWISNLPKDDWLNGSPECHENNHHAKKVLNDIYGDSLSWKNVKNGWFVDEMPDLNQKNPFLANYIIQNTLWWIEYSGIDGIREDTYPYSDRQFLANWAEAILSEYPDFNIVGEVWIHDPVFISTYQAGSYLSREFDSHLPSVTDFGLFEAFGRVFNRDESIKEIYSMLQKDFLYPDPNNLLTFLDNHDVMRTIDLVNGDIQRFKLALQILLTTRGIPQIYYGTEIGLKGGDDHGYIRRNFPGGFPEDKRNAFEPVGRTHSENDIWQFMKMLIDLRKSYKALSRGRLTHYPVSGEFYRYVRSFGDETILLIANNMAEDREIDSTLLDQIISSGDILENLKTGKDIIWSDEMKLNVPGHDLGIFKINKAD